MTRQQPNFLSFFSVGFSAPPLVGVVFAAAFCVGAGALVGAAVVVLGAAVVVAAVASATGLEEFGSAVLDGVLVLVVELGMEVDAEVFEGPETARLTTRPKDLP